MGITLYRSPDLLMMGEGSIANIGKEAKKYDANHVLVVADAFLVENKIINHVFDYLTNENITYDINQSIIPEPPFELLERIGSEIREKNYDLIIGIGGGSVLDSAKILSILAKYELDLRSVVGTNLVPEKGLPFFLTPTTSGTGSEVTWNAIFTDEKDHVKKGIVSPYLLPQLSIVDPELTYTMPPSVTAATGMDALVHAIESYTSLRTDELNKAIALQAIKLINKSLRKAVHNGKDRVARADMSNGSLLAGISLANAGVGAVHALAYPLGGKFKVPHGVSNSVLLPYVMEYNVISDLDAFVEIAEALELQTDNLSKREIADEFVSYLKQFVKDIGIPTSMSVFGVTKEDVPKMAEEASKIERLLSNNPRKLSVNDIEQIYYNALG
ncbi:alcohol dehydrogenase [Ureibacillus massiliensis 4400831 = CIP 108448 = CCUG 49529]|uniref:Alcohol dehydrogenase n=1 Tax=Ureibacillus massiliensis 4400831 = CIP 108448 = CCUG 49529 TaxID=1211035 RepID=A0A0A3J157_9BACL|nr:iron-containing alcohol dehydrogenase [Ureibacillus massiliensis]KGR90681.1 alcohol dehydrogenase [Ureibacillus massiliensis 4400831 = CIP 108448 = CCUG 49529]